jgi:threonine/homoserine/homoserine lactone efflux protein
MSSGLNHGVRASVPHLLGICFGFPSMILAVGFGLGYVFDRFPYLHSMVQIVGVAYLFYLAWVIASSAPSEIKGQKAPPLSFFQAALFQWVNPKAWIMGTSALAAYTTVGASMTSQIFTVVAVFMFMAFPSAGVWLLFGTGLQKMLSNPVHQRYFNIAMGLLLVLSIAPVIIELAGKIAWPN